MQLSWEANLEGNSALNQGCLNGNPTEHFESHVYPLVSHWFCWIRSLEVGAGHLYVCTHVLHSWICISSLAKKQRWALAVIVIIFPWQRWGKGQHSYPSI
jgi:hypothetical protein